MNVLSPTRKNLSRAAHLAVVISLGLLPACGPAKKPTTSTAPQPATVPPEMVAAMVPEPGNSATDQDIRRAQEKVRLGMKQQEWIERLGWAFVMKARETLDPGYYKLAEVCALALEAKDPTSPEAMLLHGHILDSLHRFKDAEPLARKLVATRGLSYDYALLGDVLMEQGRIPESIPEYQKAMDLRPDLHSYARASYIRWLTGDLDGAIEMMRDAVGATSPQDPASVAWTCSRLALLDFQSGAQLSAEQETSRALVALNTYPPALLLKGRMSLANGDIAGALAPLEAAAKVNPLPEPQWVLADALRAAGKTDEAVKVETILKARGAVADPRTLSLFLSTRGTDLDLAVRLARQELKQREDVFTHDAMAWALAASGKMPEAMTEMDLALAEDTQDGRLFFHAASIAARSGDADASREWLARASELKQMLYPSEREQLDQLSRSLDAGTPAPAASAPAATTFPSPNSSKRGT